MDGKDAYKFIEHINTTRVESPEKKRRRLANYKLAMSILVNN